MPSRSFTLFPMMNPATPASWTPPVGAVSQVRVAFATLDRAQQRLLDAVVFDGQSCARIAQSLGASATELRQRVGAAMLALHAQLAPAAVDRDRGGAVAAMLVLRALDALDPDEAELIDVMLLHQPALQRSYDDYRALVAALCTMVPRSSPPPGVLARLRDAIGDDRAAN
jgi:hypothetical protein